MTAGRVITGIPGMDRLIGGGLPRNSVSLVSGTPGTGKSLLCLQYIYQGALKGEPGLYVTLEQSEKDLLDNARNVGLNLAPLIKNGKLRILSISLGKFEQVMVDSDALMETIKDEVKQLKAKRLVIDSISSAINVFTLGQLGKKMESDIVELGNTKLIPLIVNDGPLTRTIIWNIVNDIKKTGCTSIITSELVDGQTGFSGDNISEFLSDGIILLEAAVMGEELQRNIRVAKMRKTGIDGGRHPLKITRKGVSVG